MILLLGYGIANKGISRLLDKLHEKYIIKNSEEIINEEDYNLIIRSPGINPKDNVFNLLKGEVITDIELVYRLLHPYIILVSGSNGKTTIASMISTMLGNDAVLCGNMGYSIGDAVVDYPNKKYYVVEASSFMLLGIKELKPNIYVLSNISPCHIDYHKTLENYINSKLKPLNNMDNKDIFIYMKENKYINLNKINSKTITYSQANTSSSITKIGNNIYFKEKKILTIKNVRSYIILNIMAALGVIISLNYDLKLAIKRLKKYKLMPYRAQLENKYIINDAKSTNSEATNQLLKEYNNVYLICGGFDRGIPIYLSKESLNNIKCVFAYGDSKDKIEAYFYSKNIRVFKFENLKEAYYNAYYNRINKEYIIYSPMYPSYDQFNSFMERGLLFHELTKELLKK